MTKRHQGRSGLLSTFFLLFCALATTAHAAVLGIDFGTEYIKATRVKPGIPLDIVLTKDSRRKEISAVVFKPTGEKGKDVFPERIYGSDAMALAARFPGDVYPNLKHVLGLPSTNSKVQEYCARHPALTLGEEPTRLTATFKSKAFGDEEQVFTVEEILAMEFQSIQKNAEVLAGKSSVVKDIVITVPPFYSLEEKRAIKLAADLAGLRVLSLISDGLAVGLNYATSRTFASINEGAKPETHVVFDMGAGSTKATVIRFQGRTVKDVGKFNKTIQEVQVLGTGWDRTLGGDALNGMIVDDMISKFLETPAAKSASVSESGIRAHGRAIAKLTKEAERLRQVLSANTETQGSFEGLYEDVDFRYKLTRANFERMTEAFAARVRPAIVAAVDKAGLEIADIDSFILHGGAIRTPFIQKELEQIVGNAEKLRSNVNSDEAAVFGAGFKGAGLSPSFRVKDIRTFDAAGYIVGMNWTNVHEKPQHQALYKPSSVLGVEKTVSFQNQQDFSLDFYQQVPRTEDVTAGSAEKRITTLVTKNLTSSVAELKGKGCMDGDIMYKVGVKLNNEDGEVEITKSVLECELLEEEKKEGVVGSMKGLFGFGKKDAQEVLGDDTEQLSATDGESSTTFTSTSSSASASASASSSNKSKKDSKSKKDKKDKKASKEDGEPKTTKRLIAIPITFETNIRGYSQLPASEIKRMKQRLAAFDDSDKQRLVREESLNQLEGFTYRVRDLLSDTAFEAASTVAERETLEKLGSAAGEWIYGDGAVATAAEFKTKLKELTDIVNPINSRREESTKRPELVKALNDALNQTKSFIETVQKQMKDAAEKASSAVLESSSASTTASESTTTSDDFDDLFDDESTTSSKTTSSKKSTYTPPPPFSYSEVDITPVQDLYDTVTSWLSEKLEEQEGLPATANPVLLGKELAEKAQALNKAGMDLIMKQVRNSGYGNYGKDYGYGGSSSSSSKSSKKTSSKTKSAKDAKSTKSATKAGKVDKADVPAGFENLADMEGIKIINVAEDGEIPSEEEILEAVNGGKASSKGEQETMPMEGEVKVDTPVEDLEANAEEAAHDEL